MLLNTAPPLELPAKSHRYSAWLVTAVTTSVVLFAERRTPASYRLRSVAASQSLFSLMEFPRHAGVTAHDAYHRSSVFPVSSRHFAICHEMRADIDVIISAYRD